MNVSLQLRKHRQSFISICIVLAAGATAICLILPAVTMWSFSDALLGCLALFTLAIPFLAVYLPATFAGGLTAAHIKDIEDALPVNPIRRVFGTLLAGLIAFLAFAIILYCLQFLSFLTPFMENVKSNLFTGLNANDKPLVPWVFNGLILLYVNSFVMSYWFRKPLVGGAFGIFVTAGELLLVYFTHTGLASFLLSISPPHSASYYFALNHIFLNAVWFLCCALFVLRYLARRIERSIKIGLKGFVSAGLILGAASSIVPVTEGWLAYSAMQDRFGFRMAEMHESYNLWQLFPKPITSGVMLESFTGDLTHISPESHASRVYQVPRFEYWKVLWIYANYAGALSRHYSFYGGRNSLVFASDGSLASIHPIASDKLEIRIAEPGKEMSAPFEVQSPANLDPIALEHRGNNFFLRGLSPSFLPATTLLQSSGKLDWKTETGAFAVLSNAGATLTQALSDGTTRTWSVPGTPLIPWKESVVPTHSGKGDDRTFVLPILQDDHVKLVRFEPSGKAILPWDYVCSVCKSGGCGCNKEKAKIHRAPIPNGGVIWVASGDTEVLIASQADGTFYEPIHLDKIYADVSKRMDHPFVEPLLLEDSNLFALLDSQMLVRINLESQTAARIGWIPDYVSRFEVPTREGVYYQLDDKIILLDWKGNKHNLISLKGMYHGDQLLPATIYDLRPTNAYRFSEKK